MIKKISTIKNLAVFHDFKWDEAVLDNDTKSVPFSRLNIIYGRNYSGKTTLSRILRAFETGAIPEKYETPLFSLLLDDGKTISNENLTEHGLQIRVFNEDFVRKNLHFIINPNEAIEPFAILGDDNIKIEAEIKTIEAELGSDEPENETGLYSEQKNAMVVGVKARTAYGNAQKALDAKKQEKATGRDTGIKYKPDLAEPNYNINRLDTDIKSVLSPTYVAIDAKTKVALEKSLRETKLPDINKLADITLEFGDYCAAVEDIVSRRIGASDKIGELLREIALNEWVKEGYELHKNKREVCAFCGNKISDKRWVELEKHFDEESKELEAQINGLITKITAHCNYVEKAFTVDKQQFYSKFEGSIEILISSYQKTIKDYTTALDALKDQLNRRKKEITVDFDFIKPTDVSSELSLIFNQYETLRIESKEYSAKLDKEQAKARQQLRLQEVYDFTITIDYNNEVTKIAALKVDSDKASHDLEEVSGLILKKQVEIQEKKRQLNNEEKGALKINEYLNGFFSYHALSLQSISDTSLGEKQIRFEIVRDGKKAFNLSEGECSLISFCYFMAKLDDIETRGKKPIIWIDDPISSLDSNHIFFVYSLIATEIVNRNIFDQLFISTHNLDFLKYLKRLNGKYLGKDKAIDKEYFLINQREKYSSIQVMPKYIKEYVTEFNYLFEEIYKCANIETLDDQNYQSFYNFGNNARKFLEIYLFYKYPDFTEDRIKMERFFGAGQVPVIFTERLANEYSHLSGGIERASLPIEVPEMKSVANLILMNLQKDNEQYSALLKSINVKSDISSDKESV
ncbi:hypothetical protein FACS189485_02990 [Spirochaetia bacterium]|nr:hypothetical protein FACS189485_02990 [Spirochaetia bacterium]